ncbi:MAG: hypothetical protein ABI693_11080 [Bryobacteraceae bacterium]
MLHFGNKGGMLFALLALLTISSSCYLEAQVRRLGVIDHPLPEPGLRDGTPLAITAGPDGALWFTDQGVGRMSTSGSFTHFRTASQGAVSFGITSGPDGALWFTQYYLGRVGRITTTGEVTVYPVDPSPAGITSGPDGALWFATGLGIGRITTQGVVTAFPTPGLQPFGITAGPDGAVWFTAGSSIGRITTSGTLTQYPLPLAHTSSAIAAGPDGALWFTESADNYIGRITTAGAVIEYTVPAPVHIRLSGITAGPDGAMWFTDDYGDHIGRITMSGEVSTFRLPPGSGQVSPLGITTGPDGGIWFTERFAGRIGQVVRQTAELSASPDSGVFHSALALNGAGFAAGEAVRIFSNSTGAHPLGAVTAGADGSFSLETKIRRSYCGNNSIVGIGQQSGLLAVADVLVRPLVTATPSSLPPEGGTVTLSGYGFGPLEGLSIGFGAPFPPLASVITDINGTFTGDNAVTVSVPPLWNIWVTGTPCESSITIPVSE